MAVKLRLQRHGRGKRPFYHIVATDSRSPRDGKYIERIGDYNPLTKPATIHLDADKAVKWLQQGAEVTDTLKAIFKYKGILYKKHLLRGVAKGSFSLEEAEKRYLQWLDEHKNKVLDHEKKHHKDKTEIKAKMLEQEQKKANDREAKRLAALAAADEAKKPVAEATEEAPAENTDAPAADTETPAEN
ncbi:MAG: ribosomal protein [Bacteroidota bacterium]|nr:ribosomal protein [Bacteroidota bacterium]